MLVAPVASVLLEESWSMGGRRVDFASRVLTFLLYLGALDLVLAFLLDFGAWDLELDHLPGFGDGRGSCCCCCCSGAWDLLSCGGCSGCCSGAWGLSDGSGAVGDPPRVVVG